MTRKIFCSALLVIIAFGSTVRSDDDDTAKALAKIAALGPGVHAIKKDAKGRITSCVIVGQARISTALGKPKGLEIARDKARLAASAEFVKWLKEKVSVHQKSEDEVILFMEGSEGGGDKDALKESGKAIEKSSKTMESVSEGLTRGLQVLHVETSDADKTYTIIMGFSTETAEATKKVGKDLNKDSKATDSDPKNPQTKTDKKIEDKKVTSDDAKKFLP